MSRFERRLWILYNTFIHVFWVPTTIIVFSWAKQQDQLSRTTRDKKKVKESVRHHLFSSILVTRLWHFGKSHSVRNFSLKILSSWVRGCERECASHFRLDCIRFTMGFIVFLSMTVKFWKWSWRRYIYVPKNVYAKLPKSKWQISAKAHGRKWCTWICEFV